MGLRFRSNVLTLPGKPDLVFTKERVAVFVDGDFWHGRNWKVRKEKLKRGSNANYWVRKIAGNIARDRKHRQLLRAQGWRIVRIWESDVVADAFRAASRLHSILR